MIKLNKLPQKKSYTLNRFTVRSMNKFSDTDTTTTVMGTISTTHILNK
jgi:hypothetical protein